MTTRRTFPLLALLVALLVPASPASAHRLNFDYAHSQVTLYAIKQSLTPTLNAPDRLVTSSVGQCTRKGDHAVDCEIIYDILLIIPPYTASRCLEMARAKYASPTSRVVRVLSRGGVRC